MSPGVGGLGGPALALLGRGCGGGGLSGAKRLRPVTGVSQTPSVVVRGQPVPRNGCVAATKYRGCGDSQHPYSLT